MPIQRAESVGARPANQIRRKPDQVGRAQRPDPTEALARTAHRRKDVAKIGSDRQTSPVDRRFRALVQAGALRPDVLAAQDPGEAPTELLESLRQEPGKALRAASRNLTSEAYRHLKGVEPIVNKG